MMMIATTMGLNIVILLPLPMNSIGGVAVEVVVAGGFMTWSEEN